MTVRPTDRVTADVTNAAFMSRTENTSTVGKVDLLNPDSNPIPDIQGTFNLLLNSKPAARYNLTDWVGTVVQKEFFEQSCILFGTSFTEEAAITTIVPEEFDHTPIFLDAYFFSPSTEGSFIMKTSTYLIKPGTDTLGTTTNRHDFTSNVVQNTDADILKRLRFECTASDGTINSLQVNARDVIKIYLERIASTGTEDANEVRFVKNLSGILI